MPTCKHQLKQSIQVQGGRQTSCLSYHRVKKKLGKSVLHLPLASETLFHLNPNKTPDATLLGPPEGAKRPHHSVPYTRGSRCTAGTHESFATSREFKSPLTGMYGGVRRKVRFFARKSKRDEHMPQPFEGLKTFEK